MRQLAWVSVLMGLASGACGGSHHVARVGASAETDISGKWNDRDARETAEAMIKDCLGASWLGNFESEEGRKPALRIRRFVNKSNEHIDHQVFIKSIERAMVNSGKVKVLAQEGAERGSVEAEQDLGASGSISDDTAASIGNETGADYVITVRLASILDQRDGKQARFYKINMELLSPNSGEKVWIGDHEIKKLVAQDSVSW